MKAAHRRELKHDWFVDGVLGVWNAIRQQIAPYKGVAIGVGVVIVLAVVGTVANDMYQKRNAGIAWEDIYREQAREKKGEGEANYALLASKHAGTKTEPWILYNWALQAVEKTTNAASPEEKKKSAEQAAKTLTRLRTKFPDHVLTERSAILLGQVYEDLGEWNKAAEIYRAVSQSPSLVVDAFLKQQSRFGLAYSLERQGQIARAEVLYRELSKLDTSYWGNNARYRLDRLKALGN